MKKLLSLLMTFMLAFALTACSSNSSSESTTTETSEESSESTDSSEPSKEESETSEEKSDESSESSKDESKDESSTDTSSDKDDESTSDADMPGSTTGGKKYKATIDVKDYGTIVVELDEGIAPQTVQNFVDLAESGFYDGLTFHRIIDGFMIQGGDPNGDGTGGADKTVYGEFKANGFNNTLDHTRGVISMARSQGYNSGSSQFFIVQEDHPELNEQYAGFGHVIEGMEVVDAIAQAAEPTDNNGTIEKDAQPVINSVIIEEE